MKKLNKKGFTLVELLAVIIILAIVVGITIPAVTNTINSSKNNSLKVAIDSAENWIAEQYAIYNADPTVANTDFKTAYSGTWNGTSGTKDTTTSSIKTMLNSAGLATASYSKTYVYLDTTTGKVCIGVYAIPETSQYYNTQIWNAPKNISIGSTTVNASTPKTDGSATKFIFSKSCTTKTISTSGLIIAA